MSTVIAITLVTGFASAGMMAVTGAAAQKPKNERRVKLGICGFFDRAWVDERHGEPLHILKCLVYLNVDHAA